MVGAIKQPTKRIRLQSFGKRSEVERYTQKSLQEMARKYDTLMQQIELISAALLRNIETAEGPVQGSVIKMLSEQHQRYRQVLADKCKMLGMLIKQFELMSELDRPDDNDPRFAPVTLNLNVTPPPDAFAESGLTLEDEDVQTDDQ